MSNKLTEIQRRFADEYIITGTAYRSAIKAGYSEKYAKTDSHKLLENTRIKLYIDERIEKIKSEKVADQQEVMEYLTSVMRGKVQDEQLLVISDGEFGSEVKRHSKRSDTTARTKAAELLGKRFWMWAEKVEHSGAIANTVDLSDFSVQELRKLANSDE